MKSITKYLLAMLLVCALAACESEYSIEDQQYLQYIDDYRVTRDSVMEFADYSPFNKKGKVEFHPLNYFEPTMEFVFYSKLFEYENKDTVQIFGTKGDEREAVRYGYLELNYDGDKYKLNLYETRDQKGNVYYMNWFTDKTTNDESYAVGRYLNFRKSADKNFTYKIDFNMAYNPYCAYSKDYSCTIPLKEDYIDLAITAGEKKFHE
ncbi:MAG: DUF1684 domain-containing protein [Rhodothermaceae bacterium]